MAAQDAFSTTTIFLLSCYIPVPRPKHNASKQPTAWVTEDTTEVITSRVRLLPKFISSAARGLPLTMELQNLVLYITYTGQQLPEIFLDPSCVYQLCTTFF
jgi:hypothetical protein